MSKAFARMTTRKRINTNGAYKHNNRLIEDKNVFSEYSAKNVSVSYMDGKTYRQIELEFEKLHKEKTGRKAHSQSMPLREIILLTGEHTKIEDIKAFSAEVEKKLGFKLLQINWHKDEGHIENGEFIENKHCHIMFEAFDRLTGKTIRPPEGTGSILQDIASETMRMERGTSKEQTQAVHLEPGQYRQQQKRIVDVEKKFNKKLEISKDSIDFERQNNLEKWSKIGELEAKICKLKQKNRDLENDKNGFLDAFKFTNLQINRVEENLQELFNVLGLDSIKHVIKTLKDDAKLNYGEVRESLKKSGLATQDDYVALKKQYEEVKTNYDLLLTEQLAIIVDNEKKNKQLNNLSL